MSYNQTVDPASFPITLQQVKEWTRVDATTSDAELSGLIQAATDRAERIMDRPLINRTYTLTLDAFKTEIRIYKMPLQSVTSIQYEDTDGDTQTLATSVYKVDLGSPETRGRITEAFGQTYPSTRDENGAVTITFVAGFGANWNSIPQDIQQAIAYLVGHYYDTRDIVGDNMTIPETARDILEGHKVAAL